jgi:hypothetical protein
VKGMLELLKTCEDLQISLLSLLLIPCLIGLGFGASQRQTMFLSLLFHYIQFHVLFDVFAVSLKCTFCAL